MRERQSKVGVITVLVIGVVMGVSVASTPAVGHVAGWLHNWTVHIRPRADARYLQASTKLKPGHSLTGVYSAWGVGGGYIGDAVTFRIPLTADIADANVHFISGAGTTDCPGPGQAAAGHLCVYQMGSGASTFQQIYASGNPGGGSGSSKEGFGILFDTSGTTGTWSFGEWTVKAPAATLRPVTGSSGGSTTPN
jgi:hypothetical protein